MRFSSSSRAAGLLAIGGLLAICGCINIDPGDGGNNNDNDNPQPAQSIRVRIINTTDTTLDPEIYVSAEPVGVTDLFAPSRKFTAFGVGTLGLLGPFGVDEITLDCAAARVVGTRGGRFGDDLNNPAGTGRQIVLTQDLNLFCDGLVTLTYSRSGSGFTTTFDVEP